MAISVLMGPEKSGKTEALYQSLESGTDAKYRVLLVPDQFKVETERLLGERYGNLLLFVKVMSLSGLAERLLKGVSVTPITRVGETLVISDILQEHSSLRYFRSTTRPNALSALVSLIDEMDAPLSVREELLYASEDGGSVPEIKSSFLLKVGDINQIYDSYLARLSGKYTDDARMTGLAAEYAASSDFVKNAAFFIDHYDELSDNEAKLVSALAEHAKGVVVSLNIGEGEVYAYPRRMLEKLPSKAKRIVFAPNREDGVFETLSHQVLGGGVLEDAQTLRMSILEGHVAIYSAEDVQQEADFVASEVYRLIQSGVSPSEIAVLSTDLSAYRATLGVTFAKYGIPYFLESRIALSNNPLFEWIDGYLEWIQARIEQRSDLAGLKTMLLSGVFPLPGEVSLAYWRKILERGSTSTGDPSFSAAEQVLAKFLDLGYRISKKQGFSDMLRALVQALLYETTPGCSVRSKCELHSFQGVGDEKSYGARLWNRFVDAVEELHVLSADVAGKSLKQLRELVATAFRQITIPVLPVDKAYVVVGPTDRARTHEISHLFVMGALRGRLPAAVGRRSVFNAKEAEFFEGLIGALGDVEAEAYHLHMMLTRPTERLIFTYPRDISDGYSKLFDLIRDDRTEPERRGRGFHECVDAYLFEVQPREFAGENCFGVREDCVDEEVWNDDLESVGGIRSTDFDAGFFYPTDTSEICILSASGVEDFAKCPALYFASRRIRPSVLEPTGMTPLSMGNIVHTVMEHFFKDGFYARYLGADAYHRDEVLQTLTEEAWKSVVSQYRFEKFFTGKGVSAVHERNLKLDCERAVQVAIRQVQAGSLIPTRFEQNFVVEDEERFGENVRFTGKIDRIDQAVIGREEIYRIIDYKTGKIDLKGADFSHIMAGEKIQLPAYAMAAELGGIEGIPQGAVCAGLYLLPASYHRNRQSLTEVDFSVQALQGLTNMSNLALEAQFGALEEGEDRSKIVKTFDEPRAELPSLDMLVDVASRTIRETAERVREGVFERVQSAQNCASCAYRYVCGLDMSVEQEDANDGAE